MRKAKKKFYKRFVTVVTCNHGCCLELCIVKYGQRNKQLHADDSYE